MTQTSTPRTPAVQVKTLLNRVHPVNRFVYDKVQWADDHKQPDGVRIDVSVRPRRGSRGICSGVGKRRPGYDHLDERCFDFVPLWGIAVVTGVRTRCGGSTNPRCGVTVEQAPRAHGKTPMTVAMQVFLARGDRRLSGQEVADVFGANRVGSYT